MIGEASGGPGMACRHMANRRRTPIPAAWRDRWYALSACPAPRAANSSASSWGWSGNSARPARTTCAGAIYPLFQRLERQGLLASESSARGKRERRLYVITATGLRELRAWIGPPLRAEAVTVTHDPLRSRVRFLGALTPAQRARWLRAASDALDQIERQIREWDGASAMLDPYAAHMTVCGLADLAARRAWLATLPDVSAGAPREKAPQRTRSGSGKSR